MTDTRQESNIQELFRCLQKKQVPLNVPDAIIKCFRQSASSAMPRKKPEVMEVLEDDVPFQTGDLQVPCEKKHGWGGVEEAINIDNIRQHLSNDSGGLGDFKWNHLELAVKTTCLEVGNLFWRGFPFQVVHC